MPLDMIDERWQKWLLIVAIVGLLFVINAPVGMVAALIVIVAFLYSWLM